MDARQVKRVLFQAPQVISLSTDITVASKVEFLQKSFGLKVNDSYYDENKSEQDDALDLIEMNTIRPSNDDIRTVIAGMPTLLLCSIENNLRPKAEYLFDVFDGDILELRQAVLTLPTLLGYSLDKRIRPRMECILNNGLRPIKITIGITMKDEKFDDWVENASLKLSQSTMNNNNNMSTFPQNFDSQKSSSMSDRIDDSLSIVLRNPNQDNNRNGRIVHWTRNDM
jgi:mTERF domain-containing protein